MPRERRSAIPRPGADALALVGFMGAGKTSVGRRLASLLGWDFIDTDEEIVRHGGRSIAEIFAERGEDAFRDLEASVVRRALAGGRRVVALGGGALTRAETRRHVLRAARVVYLRATSATLRLRLESPRERDVRPLLRGEEFPEAVLRARTAAYEAADLILDTDGRTVEDVAAAIRSWLRGAAS